MTCVLSPPVVRGREEGDPPLPAVGARRLLTDPYAVDAVCAALSELYEPSAHSAPSAAGGGRGAPVVLAATDYTGYAADEFVARRDNGSRRLRASDSVALEPSGLLQRFIATTGWQGPGYVLGSRPADGQAAVDLARAMAGSGRAPCVYVCEVLRRPDTGVFWAVATRVAPGLPPAPLPVRVPVPVPVPPGIGAVLWERSAVARAYLRQIALTT
ncbi:hypothetical protein [Streptomyces sp. H34-S4]|uniref:hypothetical protein n=1 Tax=Streptomyces sp. H34-S4 TaxID=2996463 RepID=UPI002270AC3D|nr:hypothetical protein [Streptomyces sp. H34-S4]MCY0937625.1 hypothetical protein [Streptomyces sp. H34-S4]